MYPLAYARTYAHTNKHTHTHREDVETVLNWREYQSEPTKFDNPGSLKKTNAREGGGGFALKSGKFCANFMSM